MSSTTGPVEEQLAKLEELFREGFIIEEDYRARKAELTMQGQRQTTDRSEGQSSCSRQGPPSTPPHEAAGDYDELLSAEDEDDSEEDFYWECDRCQQEILGACFHCFHCGGLGFDLCRSCRAAGIAEHDPAHKFQVVHPSEVGVEREEFLKAARHTDCEPEVIVRQPYAGVTEFELKRRDAKSYLFATVDNQEAEQLVQALPAGLRVDRLSREESELAHVLKEEQAISPLPGKKFTKMEVDLIATLLHFSADEATYALENADGNLALALVEGEEDEDDEDDEEGVSS
jgi:NACalpha-BTF3-like transcription factor